MTDARSNLKRGFLAPLRDPVVIDANGMAWVPELKPADESDGLVGMHVHTGLRVAWATIDESNILLYMLGGPHAEPGFEEEGLVTTVTRQGLLALIYHLLSIDAQLGAIPDVPVREADAGS